MSFVDDLLTYAMRKKMILVPKKVIMHKKVLTEEVP